MYNRKIYGSAAATANNIANVTVPTRGRLVGVQWSVQFNCSTDDGGFRLELSLASATEIATNQAQQCISELCSYNNFVTSGMANVGINLFVPVDVPLAQGQLIYLHGVLTGTCVFVGGAVMWLV